MSLICSSKDVDRLIGEMRHWGNDPDLRRIADALPIEMLEAAYVAKLDALPPESVPWVAPTAREKLRVMRRVFAAWCRSPLQTLGELQAYTFPNENFSASDICDEDNAAFVRRIEARYPPPK